jgi:zinc finger CCHC domain-containing protein 8
VEVTLESGEETYYPALHVGSEKSCAVVCMSLC